MKKKAPPKDDPRFEEVVAAFAKDKKVTSGKMMASQGLKIDGKIFAMLREGRLVTKLPKARVDALVESGEGERFDPRGDGRLMKEWLVLNDKPTNSTSWIDLAKEARSFVSNVGKASNVSNVNKGR